MDKDALIVEIGRLIVGDGKVSSKPWDAFALVAWYGDGVRKLNGFRYVGDGAGEPATPADPQLESRVDALREATQIEGKAPWRACVVKLERASAKATVDFEYDAPQQWEVTPATMKEIAERARP